MLARILRPAPALALVAAVGLLMAAGCGGGDRHSRGGGGGGEGEGEGEGEQDLGLNEDDGGGGQACTLAQTEPCNEVGCLIGEDVVFETHTGEELRLRDLCGKVMWIQVGTEDT